MSILTNHSLCPELLTDAAGPWVPISIDVSDIPTWLVLKSNPNTSAVFNSYMRIQSPYASAYVNDDKQSELVFPGTYVAEQGFKVSTWLR